MYHLRDARREAQARIQAAPMSTEEARKLMEDYIKSSCWFKLNMKEPAIGGDGVPACAILLGRKGESVYRCFVETRRERKGKHVHYCTQCEFKSKRLHRVIRHQRQKRGHKPPVCPILRLVCTLPPSRARVCMAAANPFRICHSDFRGYSKECLRDHEVRRIAIGLTKNVITYGLDYLFSALTD